MMRRAPSWDKQQVIMPEKNLHVMLIRIITLSMVALLVLITLTTFHPMLRTVEPQTIHYHIITGGLNQSEREVALDAASIAFASWQQNNPELIFVKGNGGMTIVFADWFPRIPVNGVAICPFWENSENWCHIIVSSHIVRDYPDPQFNKYRAANTLAHEIGHVLGFMHTSTRDNIMYGPFEFDRIYEQKKMFVIPERYVP